MRSTEEVAGLRLATTVSLDLEASIPTGTPWGEEITASTVLELREVAQLYELLEEWLEERGYRRAA